MDISLDNPIGAISVELSTEEAHRLAEYLDAAVVTGVRINGPEDRQREDGMERLTWTGMATALHYAAFFLEKSEDDERRLQQQQAEDSSDQAFAQMITRELLALPERERGMVSEFIDTLRDHRRSMAAEARSKEGDAA